MLFAAFVYGASCSLLDGRSAIQRRRFTRPATRGVGIKVVIALPARPKRGIAICSVFFTGSRKGFCILFLIVFTIVFSATSVKDNCVGGVNNRIRGEKALVFSESVTLTIFAILAVMKTFLLRKTTGCVMFGRLA